MEKERKIKTTVISNLGDITNKEEILKYCVTSLDEDNGRFEVIKEQ